MDIVLPKQTKFCVALVLEAFEKLGCSVRTAIPGQKLERVPHVPKLRKLADYLYKMLEQEARLIDMCGSAIIRTNVTAPPKSAHDLLQDLLGNYPDHVWAHKLTYLTGSKMAEILTGEVDGIKLIFGTEEGRELASGLYGKSLLNLLSIKQMENVLTRITAELPSNQGPLRIIELGAGTGGFTANILPILAATKVPVEYIFTDLAPSMVAGARRRFKEYPFITFRSLDIEEPAPEDLLATQHIVIAHNCVHATHSLTNSTKNIHGLLRPDGFLMLMEMTSTVYWVDMIFGVFEGWWLFDDGREHAIAHQNVWEETMRSVGYGHVDWTDGHRPEAEIQRVIIALASGPRHERQPLPPKSVKPSEPAGCAARQAVVDEFVRLHTQRLSTPVPTGELTVPGLSQKCVLVTGASGSLGSHLIGHLANLPDVKNVICLNRRSSMVPELRQQKALESRGIFLDSAAFSKLDVFETDTTKPMLDLPIDQYEQLLSSVTHIIHNAWPMSGKRRVEGFKSQFQVMRKLIDFALDISSRHDANFRVGFQLISSIATVGHYPL